MKNQDQRQAGQQHQVKGQLAQTPLPAGHFGGHGLFPLEMGPPAGIDSGRGPELEKEKDYFTV